MKLAMIGSCGHSGTVLGSAALGLDVEFAAVARWGPDDPLPYVGTPGGAPAETPIYDDYRRMLDEVHPDIVGVFMPLHRNAEASIAAAEHGCHIIGEKPLATKLDDLAELRKAVEAAGVQVAAMMTMRAEAPYQAVRRAVAEGRIGEAILAFGQKSYPFANRGELYKRRETYGGSIPWAAIHAIDFVSWCSGKDYARVAAMHANTAHPERPGMEDNGGLLLEFVGGGHAAITFDYLRPWGKAKRRWGDDRLRIVGTDGVVEIVREGACAVLVTPDADRELPLAPAPDFLAEFIAAVSGRGEGLITTSESFRATEVALKARDAADSGRIVEL